MRTSFSVAGVAAVLLIGLLAFSTCYGQGRPQVTVSLLSGLFGKGSYVISAALEEISKKHHPWLRISHSESPGFVFNRKKLAKEPEMKKTLIVGHGPVINWLGEQGLPPFDAKLPPVKLIANCKVFSDYSDLGKLISPEALPWGWKVAEIHPGALKAYKDAGILK